MKPQNTRLLNFLKKGYRVNPKLALQTMGINRLASRINEIKDQVPIEKGWIKVTNKFGETCRVREYWTNA